MRTRNGSLGVLGVLLSLSFVMTFVARATGAPQAYVANHVSGTVSVIDTATNTVVGEPIPVGDGPWALAVHPAGTRVYVANVYSDTVSVIDTATNTLVGVPIPVGSQPLAIAIGSDTMPPAAITNLTPEASTTTSVTLSWTAPGDDGMSGTATGYDLRYALAPITDATWASATPVSGEATPQVAGTSQSFAVPGLSCGTTYYFALKTADEVPNWSGLSNSPSRATAACDDPIPPAAVTNLTASSATPTSVTLSWTAPGDDGNVGTATSYDIRYATTQITETTWASASQASGEPTPHVAGTTENFTVPGLTCGTTYYFSLKSADDVPNWSALSNSPNRATAPCPPTIGQSPTNLKFTASQGGPNPAARTLNITNTGGGTLSWAVSDDAAWLTLSPTSGTTTTENDPITVSVNTTGLVANTYSATITIAAPGATNTPQTVPVTFTVLNTLTVTKSGNGAGTVTSNPVGLDCGAICTATFEYGTPVILTPAPAMGSEFSGWSGEGCSGTGTCTVSLTQARTVTATFTAVQGPTGLTYYEDFSGDWIRENKWQNLEFVREIRAGKLVSVLRAATSPQYVNNSLEFSNPASIQSFRADVRLNSYTAPPGGSSRVRLSGMFYNDGTTGAGQTGDVWAQLYLQGTSSGVNILYHVSKCRNSNCSTGTDVVPATSVKSVALGGTHTLGIAWNGSVFTFSVDGVDTVVNPADCANYPACQQVVNATPNVPGKRIATRLQMVGAGGAGYVAADFDNVYVNGALYDTFDGFPYSGPRLDPVKWVNLDFVQEVTNGQLVSKLAYVGGAGTLVNRLRFANQNAIRALRADVTVTEFDSANGRISARPLIGAFYNDGASTGSEDATGDISAHIRISSTNGSPLVVQFYSSRCADQACNNEILLFTEDLATVNVGETHALLLAWNGSVFTYGLDGSTRTFDPKPFASVVKPPTGHWKDLRVQVNASAPVSSGYIAATFDNVHVNTEALALPALAPFLTQTVAGDVTSAGVGLRGTGSGTINLTGVPNGATVQKAYLYWATLGRDDTFTSPTINSTPVAGTRIGQSDDPYWGGFQSLSYRADVTNIVSGNGTYTIAGLPALGPTINDTEGGSLVVIYSVPGAPSRVITINDGAVTLSGPRLQYYATTLSGFVAAEPPTGAKLTFIVGDGQSWTPEYAGLNTTLLATSEFNGSNGNFWDTRTYDVSAALTGGATSAEAIVSTGNDSLVWVAAILSVPGSLLQFPLTTTTAGTGSGIVTSSPSGINCSPTCSGLFDAGSRVTLTAAPAAGSIFGGWTGACTGTNPTCDVTMTMAHSITAMFKETTAPNITHIPVTSWSANKAIPITATITDNVGVQGATLYYRKAGTTDYASGLMTKISSSIYEGTIPASFATKPGVQYYIEARDADNNVRRLPGTAPGTPYPVVVGTTVFTDDPLLAGTTAVKAVHFTELRAAVNRLVDFNWTQPTPVPGGTVRAAVLIELRNALNAAYDAAKKPRPIYTEPSIATGMVIKASHLSELRTFVRGLE